MATGKPGDEGADTRADGGAGKRGGSRQQTDPGATRHGPGGTPEGHTPEKPAPDEFGKPGTPAAGLSPAVPHAADAEDATDSARASAAHAGAADGGTAHGAAAGAGAHETAHGDGDDHEPGHDAEPLGPIDWRAWGASLLGIAIAVLIAVALALPSLPR